VALVENDRVVAVDSHEELQRHGERMLPMAQGLLSQAGWSQSSLDRLAVGIGPGTFTGLRVGIALASGMALGLDRPLMGIGSLAAMAKASKSDQTVAAVLDARREELFVALFDPEGTEIVAPHALPVATARDRLRELAPGGFAAVGEVARNWPEYLAGELSDLPHAAASGLLGLVGDPADAPATPIYVRGPGALKPKLPPSPLGPVNLRLEPTRTPN
jgi:tRNA threonylcarbamoyladenosine biosynthesis protein TsaB